MDIQVSHTAPPLNDFGMRSWNNGVIGLNCELNAQLKLKGIMQEDGPILFTLSVGSGSLRI